MRLRKDCVFYIFLLLLLIAFIFLRTLICFNADIINHLFFLTIFVFTILNFYNVCADNYKTIKSIISILLCTVIFLVFGVIIIFLYIPFLFGSYNVLSTFKISDNEELILSEDKEKTMWLVYEKEFLFKSLKKVEIIKVERRNFSKDLNYKSLEEIYNNIKEKCPDYKCLKDEIPNI